MPDPVTGISAAALGYQIFKDVKAGDEAEQASAAATAQMQQQVDDWENTYGGLEENLSEYYSALTPEYYIATGLESYEVEYDRAVGQLRDSLAQRGLTDSAMAASLESQAELARAETRAGVRRDAERQVAQDKMSFLQQGINRDPASAQMNYMQQQANQASAVAGQENDALSSLVSFGVSEYLGAQDAKDTPDVAEKTSVRNIQQTGLAEDRR